MSAAACARASERASEKERERERERERAREKMVGMCASLLVSSSGSVNPGENLSGESIYTGTAGRYMCLLVLAIKTFFSPIFDVPGEKNPDEVFTHIGRGKIGKFYSDRQRENPSSGPRKNSSFILRERKPSLGQESPKFPRHFKI